jgi:LPXTG-motif cell wall-anchored protein
MEYPYWLMVAGACLVAVGFVGLVFRKNDTEEEVPPSSKHRPF